MTSANSSGSQPLGSSEAEDGQHKMNTESPIQDERERIARIIDPDAMVTVAELADDYRRQNLGWPEAKVLEVAQFAYDQGADLLKRREKALSKADTILAGGGREKGSFGFQPSADKGPQPCSPIPMILFCPACGLQHIDEPEGTGTFHGPDEAPREIVTWDNPPHRSHLCHECGHIWRPADVATEGVAAISTLGNADSPPVRDRAAQELSPGHTDLMVTPESIGPWLEQDAAARTICDFMGWPEDGPAWADAHRLATLLRGPPAAPSSAVLPSDGAHDDPSNTEPMVGGVEKSAQSQPCGEVASRYSVPEAGDAGGWRPIESAPKKGHFTAAIHHGAAGYRIVRAKRIGDGVRDTAEGSCVGWAPGHRFPAYWTPDLPLPSPPVQS